MGCRCELDQAGSGHALAEIHHAVWTGCDGSEHRGSACPTDGHRAADSKRLPTLSPPYRVREIDSLLAPKWPHIFCVFNLTPRRAVRVLKAPLLPMYDLVQRG